MAVNVRVDDTDVKRAFRGLLKVAKDPRPAFIAIASSWFKENRKIFGLKGPGQYKDLSPEYKKRKQKKAGFVYPILQAVNGRIKSGLTEDGSEYNFKEIGKTSLVLGVRNIVYARRHQVGDKVIPRRPFIFNKKTGGEQYQLQMQRWINIMTTITRRRMNNPNREA